jgi:peptidylprolyl isomerase
LSFAGRVLNCWNTCYTSVKNHLELDHTMKHTALILLLAASTVAASAQSTVQPAATAKPATTAKSAAKPATTTAKSAAKPAAKSGTRAARPAVAADKLPPGVPVVKAIKKTLYTASLRYQDIKIGDGTLAEPNKLYKIHYIGWRAADGVKFDSSYDHPGQPLKDKDGKPVLGADGKPKLGDPQPLVFPQGMGRTIAGFDQGFEGMKVGGKRRIFIPWQLGYGMRAIPDHGPEHPGIPAKSDLVFDVELLAVMDMPTAPTRPAMMPGGRPLPGVAKPGAQAKPGTLGMPAAPASPNAAPTPAATTKPATPVAPATAPAATATPAQPQTK